MLKRTLVCLSVASLFTATAALAADAIKVDPAKQPTETMTKAVPPMTPADGKTDRTAAATAPAAANCTQAELTDMNTKAAALTDKEKQKMTMGHLDMAKKSMDQKDMTGCAMHMKEASSSMGTVAK